VNYCEECQILFKVVDRQRISDEAQATSKKTTDLKKRKIQGKRRLTRPKVDLHYKEFQRHAPLLSLDALVSHENNEYHLVMPSTFSEAERKEYNLDGLAQKEIAIRVGFGHDILEKLRKVLAIQSFLTRQGRNIHGQQNHTRSEQRIASARDKALKWKSLYVSSWKALSKLAPSKEDLQGLRPLDKGDLKVLREWLDAQEYRAKGQSSPSLPWIWTIGDQALPPGTEEAPETSEPADTLDDRFIKWQYEGRSFKSSLTQ
jgi:hypothetical protein